MMLDSYSYAALSWCTQPLTNAPQPPRAHGRKGCGVGVPEAEYSVRAHVLAQLVHRRRRRAVRRPCDGYTRR